MSGLPSRRGQTGIACHVIGTNATQETKVHSAFDDVAGNMLRALQRILLTAPQGANYSRDEASECFR